MYLYVRVTIVVKEEEAINFRRKKGEGSDIGGAHRRDKWCHYILIK